MGLEGASTEALARSKTDYETFLADPKNLKLVREKLATEGLTAEQRHVLEVIAMHPLLRRPSDTSCAEF